jgi:hypothetical protein
MVARRDHNQECRAVPELEASTVSRKPRWPTGRLRKNHSRPAKRRAGWRCFLLQDLGEALDRPEGHTGWAVSSQTLPDHSTSEAVTRATP